MRVPEPPPWFIILLSLAIFWVGVGKLVIHYL